MAYKQIGSYGVIGDMHSVALVGTDGSIDWLCLPRFDSPSVFGRILDDQKGGFFQLKPVWDCHQKQMYLADTNVLLTRFLSPKGLAEVTDFMPIRPASGGLTEQRGHQLVRIARAIREPVTFRLECRPAFDYARATHTIRREEGGVIFESQNSSFGLLCPADFRIEDNGVVAEFTLQPNESMTIALRHDENQCDCNLLEAPLDGEQLQAETVRFWRGWMARCRYRGRWREMVNRSALVLKLLTYQPSGAIVAAATTSLPESIGSVRNWDYRFTWVRDAAFSVYALMRLGYTEEAAAFEHFMHQRTLEGGSEFGPLYVMYGIDGRHNLEEYTLDHLDGYMGSKPVRIGNGASTHLQLDVYGELMDSIYLHDKYGTQVSWDVWQQIERMLDWLADAWNQPDRSIWEVRGGMQHFTYSKLQCWVAFDRGIRLAAKRSLPTSGKRWAEERDNIYRSIMDHSWNEEKKAFTQFDGSDAVDASTLLMPLMLFIGPKDPRMLSTLELIEKDLTADALVYRYKIGSAAEDGLPGEEGTFSICSFWLVEALTRAGKTEQAQLIFEKMLTYANHLGLYSEQISSAGDPLGNFPQAFTHLGLISAAFNLNRALGGDASD
ncbi:MAG: glycoside hydrolase family 15 protein [Bryobacteraceae bacterium]|nr:glycoside hydrolase family 15 protein [Bryobacteraceae bacterium]